MTAINGFKAQHGLLEESDRTVATTLHLMHHHRVDLPGAQERVSRAGGDHGVSGWYLEAAEGALVIYQTRISATRSQVLKGLEGAPLGCPVAGLPDIEHR